MRALLNKFEGLSIEALHLNWIGEPLLNPDFVDLLHVVSEYKYSAPFHWHTNGTLITPSLANEIVGIGFPHKVYVSIDGGSESSHNKNRGKGTFSRSIKGLKNLIEARGDDRNLKIGIYQLDLGENQESYDEEFLALTDDVDEWVRVNPISPNKGDELPNDELIKTGKSFLSVINSTEYSYRNEVYPQGPCFWVGNALCIYPNGDSHICLLSNRNSSGFVGNVFERDINDILSDAHLFRQSILKQGRDDVDHCRGCLKNEGSAYVDPHELPIVT